MNTPAFQLSDAITAAHKLAREQFETFADVEVGDVVPDEANAMQVHLMRWQRDRFGLQVETHDLRMALGIIEEMGETADAETAEMALDGLGDTCVYAGQLLIANRLAIGPVLDLARVFAAAGGEVVPLKSVGQLAHTVLKASQKIRGLADQDRYRTLLVHHVAMCIAKAIDDVEIGHGLSVKAAEVYRIVGAEVLQRKPGDVMIPARTGLLDDAGKEITTITPIATNKAVAESQLGAAVDSLIEAERVEGPGDFMHPDAVIKEGD